MKKKGLGQVLSVVMLAFAMLITMIPSNTVEAATKKVTTKLSYVSSKKKILKAPKVKTGTTKVTCKGNKGSDGYVRFTAPKKGTYVITISGVTSLKKKSDLINGYFEVEYYDDGFFDNIDFTLKNGKKKIGTTTSLNLASASWFDTEPEDLSSVYGYTYSKEVTLKMAKNQTIYFYSSMAGVSKKGYTYTLKIKKK